jgi:hypothetical protein
VDITYYDSGYIDPNYYVYTADAFVDLGQFIVEDYLDADYFENTGVAVTLTCEGTRVRFVEASADLVANFSQSVNGIIDVRAEVTLTSIANLASQEIRVREFNSDLVSEFTHTAAVSATLRSQVTFSSIASQLTVAFQNATGTITMETLVSVTAIVGVIKEFSNHFNVGIRTPSPNLALSVEPFFGVNSRFNTWTLSVWIRRDTVTGTFQPIVGTQTENSVNDAAFVFIGSNIQTRFNYDPDEPEAVWFNVAPTDSEWHHYVIRTVTKAGADYGSNAGSASHWRLWIDGVAQGQTANNGYQAAGQMTWNDSSTSPYYGSVKLGHGIVANTTGGYDRVGRTLDGAMAQLWMGSISDADFDITDFYEGYVDFGTNGTRNGRLPTPFIYTPLEPTYTDLGVGVTQILNTPAWSGEYLKYTTTGVVATVTAQPEAVLLVVAALESKFDATINAIKNIGIVATVTAESTVDVVNTRVRFTSADLSVVSTVSVDVVVFRSDSATLTTDTSLACVNIRVRFNDVAITAASTVTATVGETTEFNISLESTFTQVTEISRTRNLVSALESTATFTAQIDDRLRDQSAAINSAFTIVCDSTRIPSIAVAMSSEFSFQCEAEKTIIAFGTLTVIFTQTAAAFKVVIAQANLVIEAFELTQGDILNFDPCREIKVDQETRAAKILPESRLLIVESETRRLKVPQETRVLRVDYETRVNTIKC